MDDVGLNGGVGAFIIVDGRIHRVGTSAESLLVVEDSWCVVGTDEEGRVRASNLREKVLLSVVDGPRFGGAGTVEAVGAKLVGELMAPFFTVLVDLVGDLTPGDVTPAVLGGVDQHQDFMFLVFANGDRVILHDGISPAFNIDPRASDEGSGAVPFAVTGFLHLLACRGDEAEEVEVLRDRSAEDLHGPP